MLLFYDSQYTFLSFIMIKSITSSKKIQRIELLHTIQAPHSVHIVVLLFQQVSQAKPLFTESRIVNALQSVNIMMVPSGVSI